MFERTAGHSSFLSRNITAMKTWDEKSFRGNSSFGSPNLVPGVADSHAGASMIPAKPDVKSAADKFEERHRAICQYSITGRFRSGRPFQLQTTG
jgi:hypothetical protein